MRAKFNHILFGETIKQTRLNKGWKQKAVAEMIGCTQMQISQYERGEQKPCIELFAGLCSFVNQPMESFITNHP